MQYKLKVLLSVFCLVLALIFINASQASALTIGDISSSGGLGGSTSSYPTASLVNDGGTIYFISGTIKVPFTNYKAFTGLGYSLKNVAMGNLANYNLSQSYNITTANAPHPWGSWLSYKGVVYYLTKDGMIGVPSADVFLADQGQWGLVVKANNYDIAILKANPSLPVLAYSDSRLVSQPALAFSSQPNIPSSPPVISIPVVAAPAATTSTTTVVSYLPQLSLPANIYASSTTTFTAPSADPYGPLAYTFTWDDGTPSDPLLVSSAVHTYYLPGVYMLNVSVLDNKQNTYSTTVPITVVLPPNQTPSLPQLTLPSGIIVGQAATVSASATDPENFPLTYIFSWGDGSINTAAPTNSTTHVYSTSGDFMVGVTAVNKLGFSSTNSSFIYIAP